ncbi:hypothetical protein HN51_057918 [Arachis hypogaea]|uniref:GDSL esterase/lipase n=1 Tax=Arachis hypogaea TaxID=3818 RepID=A0A444WYV7_ARAHY|nr:GDSL esterase/lipase At1g28590 [Arachis ipaensis]XP_025680913.1 GDSL esterase/lipase At1g28590 [Arachis hypogaea]QHN81046.1 GDSL esterase/lipase [Arachis hypogaea]RYQ82569.1 hypothetical protein Ahy_B10g101154 isoform A [Arachis hypogaea]RYQ82570.1 hypothetical protein Ahy_B10g101154 isoform B [Arachis hypogaea]
MASSSWVWFLVVLAVHVVAGATPLSSSNRCYRAIYSFGDSLADTGNSNYDTNHTLSSSQTLALHVPYGETFFHHPTGRWSDGRLIVDFIAEKMGVPLLKPYLGIKSGNIKDWKPTEGVNFAVAGATALDSSFYLEKGISNVVTNYSLRVQLHWFTEELLPSICHSPSECKEVLGSSLFLVGEIGGNDFNHPLFLRKNIEELRTYVPNVINEISLAIRKLIDLGAQTLLVPGNFPLGCNYIYLSMFKTEDSEAYDQIGCLKWLNKFAEYYNKQLYGEINRLQVLHPNVNIIYADYYHAALQIYQSPTHFGFKESLLSACCPPAGLPNKFKGPVDCGKPGVTAVCDDPSQFISWDGVHLTEAAYKLIAKGLLNGPYTNPSIGSSCDSEI